MDYGRAAFDRCRAQLRYPILSANADGMQKTAVVRAHGVRVGVGDSVAAARDAVRDLREREHVDAVVMIGHEHLGDDFGLARAVPGIDSSSARAA